MKLYHYQVFMPKLNMPKGIIDLEYGPHARRAAHTDKYGYINLPHVINADKAKVIEVEVNDNNQVSKIVYRTKLNTKLNLCIVMNPNGFVRTVWVNAANDQHKTLDTWRYSKA